MGTALSAGHIEEGSREPSVVSATSPARRLASWLLLLCALVSILILWGGIVRLSGSGLSIPEWPLINGSLLPPFTGDGWETVFQTYAVRYPDVAANLTAAQFQRMFAVEYFHRFLAALVGIVFLALFVRSKRNPALWAVVRQRMVSAAWLLVAQAVLGGIVVKLDLQAAAVALHLGMAFLFFGLLLWTALSLSRTGSGSVREVRSRLAWFATGGIFLQIVTGGLVAGTGAGLTLNTWPQIGSYWIPPLHLLWADWYTPGIMNLFENQVLIQFIHRWLAFVAAGLVIALVGRSILAPISSRGRIALRALTTILVLQLLLGIGNLLFKVPMWLAFSHLAMGLLLYTTLLALTHELTHPAAD
ncbi:COX15/CtaA family protein [candidate division KSB1 bacterium]|nr:COX15/CtaA family protein [candidate division KSB1 bacterium]